MKSEVAKKSVSSAKGVVMVSTDPQFRDIEIRLKMKLLERSGSLYFAYYQPVKIGNYLYIPMKNYNLYDAEVTAINDAN